MTFSTALIIASHMPILVTVAYAAIYYRQLSRALQVFCWFLFYSGLIQFISLACWWVRQNNMPLLHLYVAGGFLCLAWFYQTVLKGYIHPGIIWITACTFLLFTILNSLFLQKLFTFNSYALTTESVLIVIMTLFTYRFLISDIVKENGGRNNRSLHWINSGLLIYNASNLLIFYFGAIITQTFNKDLNLYTWIFHSFFSIVMYICFFIALCKQSRN